MKNPNLLSENNKLYTASELSEFTDNNIVLISPLDNHGSISISGPDRSKFLQGQVTINMDKAEEGYNSLAAICNIKGRMISIFYILVSSQAVHLIMSKELIDNTISTLKKYGAFFKVDIKDSSDDFLSIGLINSDTNKIDLEHTINVDSNRKILFVNKNKLNDLSITKQIDNTYFVNSQVWSLYNIRNKIPMLETQTIEEFLPANLRLDDLNGVDYDKGCYIGQEIIARMHFIGKVKKHTHVFSFSGQAQPGDKIFLDQNHVGELVSIAPSTEGFEVLGLVVNDKIDKNITLNGEKLKLIK